VIDNRDFWRCFVDAGDPAEWDRLTMINQLSPMHITRWLTPPMVEKGALLIGLMSHACAAHQTRSRLVPAFAGVLCMCQLVLREYLARLRRVAGDGYIITIASIEALSPYPSAPAYSASKWGLRGWNKAVYAGKTPCYRVAV